LPIPNALFRFLRRNRSVVADVAMGQVLNTVRCPVCSYSSRSFDPFNILSIPIPTVAEILFQVTVYRRATAWNCPQTLNRPKYGQKKPARFPRKAQKLDLDSPGDAFIAEQYVISMSRLADSSELIGHIQTACNIPAHRLKICRSDTLVLEGSVGDTLAKQVKVVPLTAKDGPCSSLAKKNPAFSEGRVAAPTQIVAFEHTLNIRPVPVRENGEAEDTADEDEDEKAESDWPSAREQDEIEKALEVYGDDLECRLVDSDSHFLSKAVSRSMWPESDDEFILGLRVDAKDHRGNWFTGSVIEILEPTAEEKTVDSVDSPTEALPRKIRVHFDNFSPKWDETYSISSFVDRSVMPVYAHAKPKQRPTEFMIHNRYSDTECEENVYFGQPFIMQCQNDWTNARAGAHVLGQACRYLAQPKALNGHAESRFLYEQANQVISDLIDVLVAADRDYVRLALGSSGHRPGSRCAAAMALSDSLEKKLDRLLKKLPFEIRVATIDATSTPRSKKITSDRSSGNPRSPTEEEVPFPFSLLCTIGNYMNARHTLVLHWLTSATSGHSLTSLLYMQPEVAISKASEAALQKNAELLRKENENGSDTSGSGGLNIGLCLTEFCKSQKLSLSDNWRCPQCKDFREGEQNMNLWRLPDLLTFHIKRFNMSARWREKISTKVNFPLTGLGMSEFCHPESPAALIDPVDGHLYDLIGVVNHFGSMTGGHYVAACKATPCGRDGREELAYAFNGLGAQGALVSGSCRSLYEADVAFGSTSGNAGGNTNGSLGPSNFLRLGRGKAEPTPTHATSAALESRSAALSAEPLWLLFDDDLVEAIPPQQVVADSAYVLFYRRRRVSPANIAKFSTLE
jgi:Ubiquitin carboxyl-terminal hydrolase